jgi:hypothetical protein
MRTKKVGEMLLHDKTVEKKSYFMAKQLGKMVSHGISYCTSWQTV